MSDPFAAVESAINRSALAALGNVVADIGGVKVSGIFNRINEPSFSVVPGVRRSFSLLDEDDPGVAVGGTVTIDGSAYSVVEISAPGDGVTVLYLK